MPNIIITVPSGNVIPVGSQPTGINLGGYLALFPFQSTYVYTSVANAGNTTYNEIEAWSAGQRQEGHPSQGIYSKFRKSFFMATTDLTPKLKDFITDEVGNKWVVLAVSRIHTYNNVFTNAPYLIETISLRLEASLETTITITPPVNSIDSLLSPIVTSGSAMTGIPAAIIETGNEVVVFQHKRGVRRFFEIYTLEEIDLALGSTITDANATIYTVTGTKYTTRLDELMQIHAIINP